MSNVKISNIEGRPVAPAVRVGNVKEYYFSRKLREVAEMNARGLDIISLGIGGPDLPPAPEVIDTLCEAARDPRNHSYQPYVGIPELRDAFAGWYRRYYGVELNPANEILPLIGSKEGIMHITMAFVNPGDAVLVPDPGYPTYTSVSRLADAEIVKYRLTPGNGWKPDFEAMSRLDAVREGRVKVMWVNYPHMPTGTPANEKLFREAVEFGRRHGIVIVNDNPYSFILKPEGEKPLSILSVPGAKDICIEMNSLSKSHDMAGWRVAMLASNPEFIGWILKVKSNIDSGQFRPVMLAAAKALASDEKWYARLNAVYSARRKAAELIMQELGCSYDPAQRGLFLWGRIPDNEESSETLADRLLYGHRVFVTPGFIFGEEGERYIRISLCATEENLRNALERIRSGAQQSE
ncbi:MAG: aminotransferase class I/II-fold pyridoxal phosphate-dependent enzyme [Muribaculaceae bacterium]|nr:aminotransferase class I/II-fold pyridoxal phosphate-dependent enzyme [Muribaculaceae bacterium]